MTAPPSSDSMHRALEQIRASHPGAEALWVAGDVSGIQRYLTGAAERGTDGAGKRLRFRSFFIQALSRIAVWRILEPFPHLVPEHALLLDAGGHFLALVPAEARDVLERVRLDVEATCRVQTEAAVALHLTSLPYDVHRSPEEQLVAVQHALLSEKRRPLSAALADGEGWRTDQFVLSETMEDAAGFPCPRCRVPRAAQPDRACRDCRIQERLGGDLARATHWCTGPDLLLPGEGTSRGEIAGWGVRVLDSDQPPPAESYRTAPLPAPIAFDDFDGMARRAEGRPLLAYVKADGDRMGRLFEGQPLDDRIALSRRVDGFFSEWIESICSNRSFYLVYGGGDDAFFVAPWDRALEFSNEMNEKWREHLAPHPVSLSCGISFQSPGYPLALALGSAEDALQKAKHRRDCVYLLGDRLTWAQAREVEAMRRELVAFAERDNLPIAALRTLQEHLAPLSSDAGRSSELNRFLEERALLLYTLARTAPVQRFQAFWARVYQARLFDPVPREEQVGWLGTLTVLRVAVTLALWSLRNTAGSGDAHG